MEVKPPKQLHKHAVPVVMVAIALLAISIMAQHISNVDNLSPKTVLTKALAAHPLDNSSNRPTLSLDVSQAGQAAQKAINSGAGGESRTPVTSLEN